jgi:hypothetical protein
LAPVVGVEELNEEGGDWETVQSKKNRGEGD